MHPLFRSFRYRNYRLFFSGQLVSLTGTWIQITVQGWLIYRLTNSPFMLGLVGFGMQVPMLVFALVGGVVADRVDKRKALIVTQAFAAFQALTLGFLTLYGIITPWHIFILAVFLGTVHAFDMPVRQAFVVDMVGKKDIGNAIALNSSMFNLARMIGPAAAGVMVGLMGEGLCFMVNALSFSAVIAALLFITVEPRPKPPVRESPLAAIKGGLSHVRRVEHLKAPLIFMGMIGFAAMPVMQLMPVVAVEMLKGGPKMLGYLMSCVGLGALAGAITLAWRTKGQGLGLLVSGSAVIYGLSIALVSFSGSFWITGPIFVFAGMGVMRQIAGCNTLLQLLVPDEFRGRVMSLFMMTFMGCAPFGSLLFGKIAQVMGVEWSLRLAGVWILIAAFTFYTRIPRMKLSVQKLKYGDSAPATNEEMVI